MENSQPKVITDEFNQAQEVIFIWQNQKIPFVRGMNGKPYSARTDRPDLPDQVYSKKFKQVCAIFNQARPYVLKTEALLEPAFELDKKIGDSLDLANRLIPPSPQEWQKASWEIIRRLDNPEIYPDYSQLTEQEIEWFSLLKKNGITFLTQGWLSIRRWQANQESFRRIPQKTKGINSALRMQDKAFNRYHDQPDNELSSVESLEQTVWEIIQKLDKPKELDKTDKELIQKRIIEVVSQLHHRTNFSKALAKKQLVKTVSLKDKLGRFNPTIMTARLSTALGRLSDRLQQLRFIMPIIPLRLELLRLEKRRLGINLKRAATTLKVLTKLPVFKGAVASAKDLEDIGKQLDFALACLYSLWTSPYWEIANRARPNIFRARQLIGQDKFIPAKVFLNQAYSILKAKPDITDQLG